MATYNGIKKIKIGDNIFNLYDSGNSGGTITQVKTTAGAHTAITVTSGAANFNVPTKTSHLTNDSGFITNAGVTSITTSAGAHSTISSATGAVSFNVPTTAADVGINFGYTTSGNNRAVKQDDSGNLYVVQKDNDANVKSATVTAETTYYLTGSTLSTTTTAGLSKHASAFISVIADSSTAGATTLTLGNNITSGTTGAKRGVIRLYGTANKSSLLYSNVTTGHSNYLPDKDGTLAVTDDITVTDVQVYDDSTETWVTTINNKVAKIPIAGGEQFGTVKVTDDAGGGVYLTVYDEQGDVYVDYDLPCIDTTTNTLSASFLPASGVTAGTYDGGATKDTGFYVPSFTVDGTGRITSATDLGILIPELGTSNETNSYTGCVVTPWRFSQTLRNVASYTTSYVLSAGSTSKTITISADSYSGYSYKTTFRVADVQCYDVSTYEPILVDWSTPQITSNGSSLTLTVSIASAHTNDICIFPIVTQAGSAGGK